MRIRITGAGKLEVSVKVSAQNGPSPRVFETERTHGRQQRHVQLDDFMRAARCGSGIGDPTSEENVIARDWRELKGAGYVLDR